MITRPQGIPILGRGTVVSGAHLPTTNVLTINYLALTLNQVRIMKYHEVYIQLLRIKEFETDF